MTSNTTIAAISTAPGIGGIAVVRVSGSESIPICARVFESKRTAFNLLNAQANRLYVGAFVSLHCEIIDEVVIAVYRAPHSFTGDDVVEISCHGSIFIQQRILQVLIDAGCRLATAGEFTQRAFFNGKMDLSQAEAVADLIASSSAAAHRMAMTQMRGGFSSELMALRTSLLDFVSLIELELDFSEEDVEFANREHLKTLAAEISSTIQRLTASFSVGNALKHGIPVALVGETNVGKSTLLNALLNEEKSIVSEIHGTTRDVIEDQIIIKGIAFRFIDTAGIRNTTDTIESLGIERTYQKIEQAAIVLWLMDSTQISEHLEWLTERIQKRAANKKVILVFNKTDKIEAEEQQVLYNLFESYNTERISISAKNRLHLNELEDALIRAANLPEVLPGDVLVSNVRHYEALRLALGSISRVESGLDQGISGDFIAQDLRECMHFLGEITGQISNDEILANIFGKFCIGK